MITQKKLLLLFVGIIYTTTCYTQENGLFLDLTGREQEQYAPFIEQAAAQGLALTYVPIDQVMAYQADNIATTKTLICACGFEFFSQPTSPLVQHTIGLIAAHGATGNKSIGFILPACPSPHAAAALFLPLLQLLYGKSIGIHEYTMRALATVFSQSADRKPLPYHTTLRLPSENSSQGVKPPDHPHAFAQQHNATAMVKNQILLLPALKNPAPELAITLPFGVYCYDAAKNNHLFFGVANSLSVLSITENFHSAPMAPGLRERFTQAYNTMIAQLVFLTSRNQALTANIIDTLLEQIPASSKTADNKILTGTSDKPKQKYAWMELVAFEPYKPDPKKNSLENKLEKKQFLRRQNILINDIFDAQLDTVWLSITPNIYYSPIARMVKKDNPEETEKNERRFLHSVSLFTKKLSEKAHDLGLNPPKIILGFEIANNLYPPHLPASYAVDCFGNEYHDIPAPLNQAFWRNEIITPLDRFLEKWAHPKISHGLPIEGVMLDLEMYCRKKTGIFSELMGFDKNSMKRYARRKKNKALLEILESVAPDAQPLATQALVGRMVTQLTQEKLLSDYWDFLTQEARRLGTHLSTHVKKRLPSGKIMCYLPSIMTNWFYKGLMQGITATSTEPLVLLTFNAAYQNHRHWFVKNSIPVEHLCVFLLSKAKNPGDSQLIKTIFAEHDGVWYNRFSRFAEPYNGASWTAIEQSPMNKKEKSLFFKALRESDPAK